MQTGLILNKIGNIENINFTYALLIKGGKSVLYYFTFEIIYKIQVFKHQLFLIQGSGL